ncbi:MAG TPA: class I SAM-dependent methyltransferase [Porticoccaceae bacterium]|nr:class I SAM-dependent methyltransferase [Porticoccaceae bacterium]
MGRSGQSASDAARDAGVEYGAQVVVAADSRNREAGRELAERLGLAFLDAALGEPSQAAFILRLGADGLALCSAMDSFGPISCEFAAGRLRHRHQFGGGAGQSIARAVGLKQGSDLHIADLTAGLGEDAFVLAGLGAKVVMIERHPVIAALLEDGLRRAGELAHNAAIGAAVARMELHQCEAHAWLASCSEAERPDVIYLDPMFPERNKSAQVRKEMQALQQIVGADADSDALLEPALAVARYRVVVKRARHAPHLGGSEPTFAVAGRATRFDVHALRRLPNRS